MKNLSTIFFFIIGIQSFAQEIQPTTTYQEEDFLLETDYQPTYYRLELNLNPNQTNFSGKTTMYLKPTESLNNIEINAQTNLNITSVSYHNNPITNYSRNGNVLSIPLPNSIPVEQLDSISIGFSGNESTSNGLSLGNHAGTPIIETVSEPWHASSWWVCKDDLLDKVSKLDVYITHPTEFKAASNGSLKSVNDLGNGFSKTHWQHNYPIPTYLIATAVTNYAEYNNSVNINGTIIPIINYLYPETLSNWTNSLDQVPTYITFLSEKFGDYPFKNEKYGHAQWNRGGGMEHSTMSFMGNFNFNLVVHELAHQWFGDQVTCATWHDIWLNEGLADYCVGLMQEHLNGSNNFKDWKQARIDIITSQNSGSVYCPNADDQSRIFDSRLTYKKGSMVTHLIRYKLNNDELFFQTLENYLNHPDFTYGYANTEDFKTYLNATTGMNWDEYFADWIYGEGHPIFDIQVSKIPNSNQLTISFNQTTSHNSVDFFDTPFEIQFNGFNGEIATRRFDLNQANTSFLVDDLNFNVQSVVPNPKSDVICKINSTTLNTSDLENQYKVLIYPNPVKEILKIESPSLIKRIKIFDQTGSLIDHLNDINSDKIEIPATKLTTGIYRILIENQSGIQIEKFIKK